MLIALSGRARAGKDSVGALLAQEGYIRHALANPLKEMALAADPIVGFHAPVDGHKRILRMAEFVDKVGWDKAKENPEVRRFLQRLGTECVRHTFGDDAWVDLLFARFEPGGKYVITDCRFPNEALATKKHNGLVVRIERPDLEEVNRHESEFALDDWAFDYTINNDGSLDDLADAVAEMRAELDL